MTNPLQNHIQEWKENLQLNGVYTEEQLLELEDHLHSELDRLLSEGKSEETAFSEASLAIGHPVALGRAYSLSNKHLILKYLGIYFLLGFPLIQGFLLLFEYSWKLPGTLLVEQGVRGFELALGTYVGPILLLIALLYLFLSKPYWLTNLVKKMSQQFYGLLLASIGLSAGAFHFAIQYTLHWSTNHMNMTPLHFIHKKYSLPLEWFTEISYQIILVLFFGILVSLILKAILSPGALNQIIYRAKLLMLIAGLFVTSSLVHYMAFFNTIHASGTNAFLFYRTYYLLISCVICFTIASFLIRKLYRNRRNLVLD